jgi:hypothetical protein
MTVTGMHDTSHLAGESYGPPASPEHRGWKDLIEVDLEREMSTRTPLQKVVGNTSGSMAPQKPLRMALSAVREDLDRRAREWRGSAQVVEQTLRQLAAAEQARATALKALAQIEVEVTVTGEALTAALASFDEADEGGDVDQLFVQSDESLDARDRAASEVAIAQRWCRSAWNAYAEALENERVLRLQIQSPGWTAG